ncbi:MAG: glycosyltransferase [Planctomycetaceae bacterium]
MRLGDEVLDLYPGADKYPLPNVQVTTAPRNASWQPLWFLRQIWKTSAETIHFHFSTVRHISRLRHVLKIASRRRRHILTLHHGQLMLGWSELTPRQRRATVRGLNAFDQIVSLSDQQTEFYREIGRVPEEKLRLGTSYLPLSDALLQSLDCASDPLSRCSDIPAAARILVASGYPEEIYQHEWCLQALSSLKQSFPVHLVLCLYGTPKSRDYLNQLLSQCERSDVTVLWDLDFAEFTSIIRQAALYLRPTQVDSFGLAVADAVNAGVPAIASTVCQPLSRGLPHRPRAAQGVPRSLPASPGR